MSVTTKDENGNICQREGGTVTRIIGIGLPNGLVVQAPVEVWIAAILQHTPHNELMAMASTVEYLNAKLQITPLTDGMAVIDKPIVGLNI